MVVVTVTHRLGILGFLDLREYGVAGSANVGLLDIVAALQWVQRNIAAEYPGEPPHLVLCRAVSAQMMASPAQAIATAASNKARRVWAYQFDQPTEVLGGLLGACHSLDLAYVFGTVERIPLTGQRPQRLHVAREVMAAWAGFVHDGDPSGVDPSWRPWTSNSPSIHHFGTPEGAELVDPPYVDMTAPLARSVRNA